MTRFLILLLGVAAAAAAQDFIHHDLSVTLHPADHRIEATDTLTVPAALVEKSGGKVRFRLHAGLEVKCLDPAFTLVKAGAAEAGRATVNDAGLATVPLQTYEIRPVDAEFSGPVEVRLRYAGVLHHPLVRGVESARSFSRTPGLIDEKGVYLSGSTGWVPALVEAGLETFTLAVSLPQAWDAVSQGRRAHHEVKDSRRLVTWDCPEPMDEVYLVAAPFTEYLRPGQNVNAYAFLRTPDPNLAARYLEVTVQYIQMYEKLIGLYPYGKFALVENFWETGFGMPSFTLLGPRIIRFPFILHASYPHEILHNWWGNSVFVDYEKGNWCEGLTAYLADHLIKEGRGQGVDYRRDTLKKYLNYVKAGRDLPLTAFRARHSAATEAVGYGKALMVFHMLRRDLGDEAFSTGLKRFYARHKFTRASFDDLRRVFSTVAGRDLKPFFEAWVTRTGAPVLELGELVVESVSRGYRVRVGLRQVQEGPAYRLRVPVAFTLEGVKEAVVKILELEDRQGELNATLEARPLRVAVDPQFDLFRRLHRSEIPPTVGQLFGADRITFVLPEENTAAWRTLAATWCRGAEDRTKIVRSSALESLPRDSAVWVLGAGNAWRKAVVPQAEALGAAVTPDTVRLGETRVPRAGHCYVITASHPHNPDLAVGWIGADRLDALAGLGRKLPHYGKYSYLAFSGGEPSNVAKGTWPAAASPLVRVLAEGGKTGAALPRRTPLARLEPVFDPARLLAHVRRLSAADMEGRGVGTRGLDRAADHLAAAFEKAGLEAGGEGGSWFQTWTEPGGPEGKAVGLRNVVGVLPGKKSGFKNQSVVVGAHYDHLGFGWPDVRQGNQGKIHPGADDNASGVAVLLEVAALLAGQGKPDRTLVFVAFSGEEWGLRGSRHYVRAMKRWPVSRALAMVNLDSVGRLGARRLTVFGTGSAAEWIHVVMGVGFTTGVEATPVANDFGSSDQKSFLDAGVPAIQVFAGAHPDYHRPTDTADKVDTGGLVKTAVFVRETLVYLSQRDRPLTSRLRKKSSTPAAAPVRRGPGRKVSLGTMPDFTFRGPGVKVASVMPDSPAQKAGLQDGDILVAVDGKKISSLRAYALILGSYKPGDTVEVRVKRGGKDLAFKVTLKAR